MEIIIAVVGVTPPPPREGDGRSFFFLFLNGIRHGFGKHAKGQAVHAVPRRGVDKGSRMIPGVVLGSSGPSFFLSVDTCMQKCFC